MKKKSLSILLLSASLITTVSLSGCKDYDDDIDKLGHRIDNIEISLKNINEQFGTLSYVKAVSLENGILTVTPFSGNPVQYTLGVGTKVYTLVSKQEDNVIKISLMDQDSKECGSCQFTIGSSDSFNPSNLTLGADGKTIYYGDTKTNVEFPEVSGSSISITEVLDNAGQVSSYIVKYGSQTTNLKIADTKIKSIVFKPSCIYSGIPAMNMIESCYYALTLGEVNADTDCSSDAPTADSQLTSMSLGVVVADYHLNPSSINPNLVKKENLSFIVDDLPYYRSANSLTAPTILTSSYNQVNGILTVMASFADTEISSIDKDGKVTELALQVVNKGQNSENDTIITSDYAAVKKTSFTGYKLVNAKSESVKEDLYTTAGNAIANAPIVEIKWNDEDGVDVAEYVQTLYKIDGSNDYTNVDGNATDSMAGAAGFVYSYSLVGYFANGAQVSESSYAALNGSVIRAQSVKDGKQQIFGSSQDKDEVGKMPVVRVILSDAVNKKVVSVGYIKIKIIDSEDTPVSEGPSISINNDMTSTNIQF